MLKYIRAFRVSETLVLSGFCTIGGVFSVEKLYVDTVIELMLIALLSFLMYNALYALNAYFGKVSDEENERLSGLSSIGKTTYLRHYLLHSSLTLIGAYIFSFYFFLGLVGLLVLGSLYSIPVAKLKGGPISGTLLHFTYQVIAFNAAYSVFLSPDEGSLMISIYFALLFSAGHLHHQVIDYKADQKSNINTGAVKWGSINMELASLALFTLATFYLLFLIRVETTDLKGLLYFLLAYVIQIGSFIYFRNHISAQNKMRQYRNLYRLLYFLAGSGLIYINLFPQ